MGRPGSVYGACWHFRQRCCLLTMVVMMWVLPRAWVKVGRAGGLLADARATLVVTEGLGWLLAWRVLRALVCPCAPCLQEGTAHTRSPLRRTRQAKLRA